MKLGPCYFTPISYSHQLTQIPLISRNSFDGGKSHGGFFAAFWGAHTDLTLYGIALMVGNLTDVSSLLCVGALTQIQRIQQKIFVTICVVSGRLNQPQISTNFHELNFLV